MGTKSNREQTAWIQEQGVLEQASPPFGISVAFLLLKFKHLISKYMQLMNLKNISSCIKVVFGLVLVGLLKLHNTTIFLVTIL